MLNKALEIYDISYQNSNKWYLMFVGAGNSINFDINNIGKEFYEAWNVCYDVVCANGIRYNGWY